MAHRNRCLVALAGWLATTAAAPPLYAQDTQTQGAEPQRTFGDAGVVAISSDANLTVVGTAYAGAGSGYRDPNPRLSVGVAPAADVFVARNVSLGGLVQLTLVRADTGDVFGVNPALRAGYLLRVGERLALWPRAGIGYGFLDFSDAEVASSAGVYSVEYTQHTLYGFVSILVLGHVAEHFFMGLAPFGQFDFFADSDIGTPPKRFSFGVELVLGGWW